MSNPGVQGGNDQGHALGLKKQSLFAPYAWHRESWSQLVALVTQGRLPHALLLSGVSGIGKHQFARAFATYLHCDSAANEPCGRCKGCLLNQNGSHPDIVQISPEDVGKAIKIDQIRDLSSFIGGSAQQGGYRVVIIDQPEEMNINAANALLKSLEEPGNKTIFLLISGHSGRLMPTIKSRCQLLSLPVPSPSEALAWLQSELGDGHEADGPQLLSLAGGAPLYALSLYQQGGFERRTSLIEGLKDVASRRMMISDVAGKWQKEEPIEMLNWFSSLVNDLARYRVSNSMDHVVNSDSEALIIKAAARTTGKKLFAFIDKIQDYRLQLISKANPNRQLMFEDLLISWIALFKT